jgi:membrane-bound serine protease (ClpP class)
LRRLAIGLLATLAGITLIGSAASAQDTDSDTGPTEPAGTVAAPVEGTIEGDVARVDVLQVSGLFDPILLDSVETAIADAETNGSQALILQVNSKGTVISDDEVEHLLELIADAPVPIGVWVGPTGARFYGTAAQILAVADVTGMAPGARIGYIGVPLTPSNAKSNGGVDFGVAEERLRNGSVGLSDARTLDIFKQRIADEGVPTVTSMLQALDGFSENGVELDTTELVVLGDGTTRYDTIATVRFSKLSLVDQLFHTVASPPVAYLLLLTGLALIIFEFFTAGVGLAGAVGAVCTVLACTGMAVLPTRPWAFALIVLAMLAFAIDVQVGIPRFWTGVGIVLVSLASLFIYEPLPGATLRPSWIALLAGIGGIVLTFIVGMPSMVRTRFATPTIGREWMIGQTGVAVEDIGPEGLVEVGGARWRARTNRATPVSVGDPIRVAAIDGITLEIEPLEGAARDYRERRTKHESSDIDA